MSLENTQDSSFGARMRAASHRFATHTKNAITYSWVNILLVFVPVGIAVEYAKMDKKIVFAMNAIAIIPLAGLLTHATESVATRLGDTLGALLNVSFGNAVELIIFIIALVKGEIRIVQASLIGSILANLLLILGMAFLLGGLRFREQVYNSTVTQMSACMLSLSVVSLLLPSAFHYSFKEVNKAKQKILKISRGTSIILLLVYILYLLFQLKSHTYLYESTPQAVIDLESHPGVLASMLNSSSSTSSDDSSSSDPGSDSSSNSNKTAKRFKRILRRRRRKSNESSKGRPSIPSAAVTSPSQEIPHCKKHRKLKAPTNENQTAVQGEKHMEASSSQPKVLGALTPAETTSSRSVGFSEEVPSNLDGVSDMPARRPFTLRQLSIRQLPSLSIRPSFPTLLTNNVFVMPPPSNPPHFHGAPALPRVSHGRLRKTASLPDRLSSQREQSVRANTGTQAPISPGMYADGAIDAKDGDSGEPEPSMSKTAAVVLLLVSTALVALCAEYLVDAIPAMADSGMGAAFIGLIILPIVGNAAEHVTAVTVAAKNKMDLAIGVAVGSSIQIAIFVTPLVVMIGWCMDKEMTLYFTLFETVSLFVTAFVVNFLVLDGRSNYLEGALLIAAYAIISLGALYYPSSDQESAAASSGK